MEATDAGLHLIRASETEAGPWDAAAKYRELLQQQHRLARERLEDDQNISSDAASGGQSPRGGSDGTADEVPDDSSDRDAILPLKHKGILDSEFRIRSDLHSPAAALAALHRHPFSPQSLLAASMRHNPPSMVAQPGLDFRAFNRDSSPASPTASAPAQEPASPPSSSAGHSPRQSSQTHTPWNYEEQFKQLYEIDDNPKRKEFLDELFQFMQNRGTPINRLPIMAKQVLDLYELFNLVVARGGLVEVINKKLWQEIIKGLKLPSSITSAAFTLRTQYMKYLYPQECNKINLSSPAELQAAIDGNRREGRRSNYSNNSNNNPYADLVSSSPFLACHMTPTFGMPNGLSTSLHQPVMTPLSLATSRAGMNGVLGQPVPPSSPFLPAMGAPMIPSANDTLMTLWNMYNKQQQTIPVAPPQMRLDGIGMAQQNEALNLGVRREISRQQPEKERERDWERSASSAREFQQREREVKRDHDEESSVERHHESAENLKTKRPRSSPAEEPNKVDAMPHTKMKINSKDDGSLVVSMEIRGNMYQGVLFAQPRSGRV